MGVAKSNIGTSLANVPLRAEGGPVGSGLHGIHQYGHFIFYRLHLRANDYLQVMLIELNHPDGAMGFQRGGVHFAHIVYRQTQTSNAVIQRNNVLCAAERRQNRRYVIPGFADGTGDGFLHAGGSVDVAARRFQIEAGDGEAEDGIVGRKPDCRHHRHQIPLGRQAMQNAKHHEVDDIAVGVH